MASFAGKASAVERTYVPGSTESCVQSTFMYPHGSDLMASSVDDWDVPTPSKRSKRSAQGKSAGTEWTKMPKATPHQEEALRLAVGQLEQITEAALSQFNEPVYKAIEQSCLDVPDACLEVPSTVVFAGMNVSDHGELFDQIASRLRASVSPLVVQLSSAECTAIPSMLSLVVSACALQAGAFLERHPGSDNWPSEAQLRGAMAAANSSTSPVHRLRAWYNAAFSGVSPRPPLLLLVQDTEALQPSTVEQLVLALRAARGSLFSDPSTRSITPLAVSCGLLQATSGRRALERATGDRDASLTHQQWAEGVPVQLVMGACSTTSAWHLRLTARATGLMRISAVHQQSPLSVIDSLAESLAAPGGLEMTLGPGLMRFSMEQAIQYSLSSRALTSTIATAMTLHFLRNPLSVLGAPLPRLSNDPSLSDGGLSSLCSQVPWLEPVPSTAKSRAPTTAPNPTSALALARSMDSRTTPTPVELLDGDYQAVSAAVLSSALWRACACRVNGLPREALALAMELPSVQREATRLGEKRWGPLFADGADVEDVDWSSSSDDEPEMRAALESCGKRHLSNGVLRVSRADRKAVNKVKKQLLARRAPKRTREEPDASPQCDVSGMDPQSRVMHALSWINPRVQVGDEGAGGVVFGSDKIGARVSRRRRWYAFRDRGATVLPGSRQSSLHEAASGDVPALPGRVQLAEMQADSMDTPRPAVVERPLVSGWRATVTRWLHAHNCVRSLTPRVLDCVRETLRLSGVPPSLRKLLLEVHEAWDHPVAEGLRWSSVATTSMGHRLAEALRDTPEEGLREWLLKCVRTLRSTEDDAVGAELWLQAFLDRAGALLETPIRASSSQQAPQSVEVTPTPVARNLTSTGRRKAGLASAIAHSNPTRAQSAPPASWGFAQWLLDLVHHTLRPPQTMPLHEVLVVEDCRALKSGLDPDAWEATVSALGAPGAYWASNGGKRLESEGLPFADTSCDAEVSSSLEGDAVPDVTVAWSLLEHAPKIVPVKAWYLGFREAFCDDGRPLVMFLGEAVASNLSEGGMVERRHRRRRKNRAFILPASDDHETQGVRADVLMADEAPSKLSRHTEDDIRARFVQTANDLMQMGVVKAKGRLSKDGKVTRLLFDLSAVS
jgi:hypothetical protein